MKKELDTRQELQKLILEINSIRAEYGNIRYEAIAEIDRDFAFKFGKYLALKDYVEG